MNCQTFSQNPRTRGKSHHIHTPKREMLQSVGEVCLAEQQIFQCL